MGLADPCLFICVQFANFDREDLAWEVVELLQQSGKAQLFLQPSGSVLHT